MGTRGGRTRQGRMWVPTADLPKSAGHPFYERLNRVLDDAGFDAFVEGQCGSFYADGIGRPSLAPGRYFRLLLLGYFEGLDSERAIAWRAADLLSIRTFLDFALDEAPPDHSTLSRTRRLIDLETHRVVFTWVLQRLADAKLVLGRTVGIDATTLEANAAMRSIVRRDTGESYDAFLTRLAEASGLSTPTRAELGRFDRTRKNKGSNADWTHPHDPDAKIAKMKDGRTHLAHTAEHAVDLETGAIVGVTGRRCRARGCRADRRARAEAPGRRRTGGWRPQRPVARSGFSPPQVAPRLWSAGGPRPGGRAPRRARPGAGCSPRKSSREGSWATSVWQEMGAAQTLSGPPGRALAGGWPLALRPVGAPRADRRGVVRQGRGRWCGGDRRMAAGRAVCAKM